MLWPLVQVSSSSRAAMEQCDRFWDGQGSSNIVGALGEGSSQLSRADPRKLAISTVTKLQMLLKSQNGALECRT